MTRNVNLFMIYINICAFFFFFLEISAFLLCSVTGEEPSWQNIDLLKISFTFLLCSRTGVEPPWQNVDLLKINFAFLLCYGTGEERSWQNSKSPSFTSLKGKFG